MAMVASRQVSASGPPSFRAKKKTAVDDAPEKRPDSFKSAGPPPQNRDRLTGPPMQKGAGQGSMFANGKWGGSAPAAHQIHQPSRPPAPVAARRTTVMAPPTRRPPGRGMPPPMMADGDPGQDDSPFADTPPIGGMPDDQGAAAGAPIGDTSGPPQGAGAGDMPVIRPESVAYHDELHTCETCQYMGQDGNCAVLQMQVSPQGGCNAFEAGAGGEQEQEPDNDADDTNSPEGGFGGGTGGGFTQNPAGTSGAPSLG